jgi:hypothetical protein
LVKYYKDSTDIEIGVITVREYLHWTHIFGVYAQSMDVSNYCQEICTNARDELGGSIDDILNAVADTLDLPD